MLIREVASILSAQGNADQAAGQSVIMDSQSSWTVRRAAHQRLAAYHIPAITDTLRLVYANLKEPDACISIAIQDIYVNGFIIH